MSDTYFKPGDLIEINPWDKISFTKDHHYSFLVIKVVRTTQDTPSSKPYYQCINQYNLKIVTLYGGHIQKVYEQI